MIRRFLALGLAAIALAFSPLAFAAPVPYVTAPTGGYTEAVNIAVQNVNNTLPSAQVMVACSGTTTATCQGTRIQVSITGLSTAASTLSATMTVTDASVTAASQIYCSTNIYAGTGIPMPVNIVPGAGSFTMAVQNISTGAALNATVPINCIVNN